MLETYKARVKDIDSMKATIIDFYRTHVTNSDETNGRNWYESANEIAIAFAEKYGFSVAQVCGVISALSPACNWSTNVADTATVLKACKAGISAERVTVSTYGPNKFKAYRILEGSPYVLTVAAQFKTDTKTKAFFYNILCLKQHSCVTVDRHAMAIALGSTGTDHSVLQITPLRYRSIAEAYRRAAHVLGYSAPCMLQACTWVAFRRVYSTANRLRESAPF